jgi:hypothetical protein
LEAPVSYRARIDLPGHAGSETGAPQVEGFNAPAAVRFIARFEMPKG